MPHTIQPLVARNGAERHWEAAEHHVTPSADREPSRRTWRGIRSSLIRQDWLNAPSQRPASLPYGRGPPQPLHERMLHLRNTLLLYHGILQRAAQRTRRRIQRQHIPRIPAAVAGPDDVLPIVGAIVRETAGRVPDQVMRAATTLWTEHVRIEGGEIGHRANPVISPPACAGEIS